MTTSPRLVYTPSPASTLDLDALHLEHGSHQDPDSGVCLLEAVALFAGEKHTDHPRCVSPLLGDVGIRLNDRATDTQRQDLKRFIPHRYKAIRAAVQEALKNKPVAGAVAVAAAGDPWNTTYDAVYAKVKPIYLEKCAGLIAESWDDAVALYADLIDPAKAAA